MDKATSKKYSKQKVAVVLLTGMLIAAFFNSPLLYRWAGQIKHSGVRSVILYAIEPLAAFCRKTELTWLPEKIRDTFYSFAGMEREAGWTAAGNTGNSSAESAVLSLQATPLPSPAVLPEAATGAPNNSWAAATAPPATGAAIGARTPLPETAFILPGKEKLLAAAGTAFSAEHPLRVFIMGDSMVADSLSPVFRRIIENNPALVYEKKSRYSSGLTRPDYYNWPAEINEHYKSASYDLVIVMLGMNDAQDMPIDTKSCYYGSDQWFAIYKARVAEFITLLLTSCRRVYWLGMPPMRGSLYNSRMEQLNQIYKDVCANYPASRFIRTAELVTNTDRKYISHLTLNNKQVKVRSDDGKHFTQAGAALVLAEVMKMIDEDFIFETKDDKAAKETTAAINPVDAGAAVPEAAITVRAADTAATGKEQPVSASNVN